MGKTTLYHPIPLSTIRGAAEYCGWKFGTIKQIRSHPDTGFSRYIVKIHSMPVELHNQPIEVIHNRLQKCFMDDIRVQWPRKTRSGVMTVDLTVSLSNYAENENEQLSEAHQRGA